MAGIVKKVLSTDRTTGKSSAEIEVRNRLEEGIELEFLGKNFETDQWKLDGMRNTHGQELQYANPNQTVVIEVPFKLFENEVIRWSPGERERDGGHV